jgi:hypothetical protein
MEEPLPNTLRVAVRLHLSHRVLKCILKPFAVPLVGVGYGPVLTAKPFLAHLVAPPRAFGPRGQPLSLASRIFAANARGSVARELDPTKPNPEQACTRADALRGIPLDGVSRVRGPPLLPARAFGPVFLLLSPSHSVASCYNR